MSHRDALTGERPNGCACCCTNERERQSSDEPSVERPLLCRWCWSIDRVAQVDCSVPVVYDCCVFVLAVVHPLAAPMAMAGDDGRLAVDVGETLSGLWPCQSPSLPVAAAS